MNDEVQCVLRFESGAFHTPVIPAASPSVRRSTLRRRAPHRAAPPMLLTALLLATLVVGTRADENDRAASPTDARPARMSPEEVARREARHLKNIRQVTRCFPRAGEGYFSPDGKQIVFQAYPLGYPFYQIYRQSLEGGQPFRLSPGRGRTTCSYFHPTQPLILFASSHRDPQIEQTEAAARRLEAQGGRRRYQWDFDPWMDIYTIRPDGTGLRQLTDTPGYDAEGSYSSDGRRIVFTSTRDGDPDIYIMDADGSNVRQITNAPGYDGGPFFSPDDRWIIFRSDRRKEHMLQLFAVSVDGKHEVQLTHNLGQVNWCPYFHPSGKYIVWASADYSRGPQFANFDLFTMDVTLGETTVRTGRVERITFHRAADVLPVFSPDGKRLMWTSTRTSDGSSQLWIADWVRED